ncbi:hypothetical protein C8R44DRAFT_752880 [Mycena epipterygia]|nr:hypothetical protein C8R44DRAFT_752880 [Mycena epipterygia]
MRLGALVSHYLVEEEQNTGEAGPGVGSQSVSGGNTIARGKLAAALGKLFRHVRRSRTIPWSDNIGLKMKTQKDGQGIKMKIGRKTLKQKKIERNENGSIPTRTGLCSKFLVLARSGSKIDSDLNRTKLNARLRFEVQPIAEPEPKVRFSVWVRLYFQALLPTRENSREYDKSCSPRHGQDTVILLLFPAFDDDRVDIDGIQHCARSENAYQNLEIFFRFKVQRLLNLASTINAITPRHLVQVLSHRYRADNGLCWNLFLDACKFEEEFEAGAAGMTENTRRRKESAAILRMPRSRVEWVTCIYVVGKCQVGQARPHRYYSQGQYRRRGQKISTLGHLQRITHSSSVMLAVRSVAKTLFGLQGFEAA